MQGAPKGWTHRHFPFTKYIVLLEQCCTIWPQTIQDSYSSIPRKINTVVLSSVLSTFCSNQVNVVIWGAGPLSGVFSVAVYGLGQTYRMYEEDFMPDRRVFTHEMQWVVIGRWSIVLLVWGKIKWIVVHLMQATLEWLQFLQFVLNYCKINYNHSIFQHVHIFGHVMQL